MSFLTKDVTNNNTYFITVIETLKKRVEVEAESHEVVDSAVVAVLQVVVDAVAELAEVVRRDVRSHADGNAGRAVQEEVRQLRR